MGVPNGGGAISNCNSLVGSLLVVILDDTSLFLPFFVGDDSEMTKMTLMENHHSYHAISISFPFI